ncbi:MAG: hypothetical protein ACP5KW_08570 [Thermoproteota archaeon]
MTVSMVYCNFMLEEVDNKLNFLVLNEKKYDVRTFRLKQVRVSDLL